MFSTHRDARVRRVVAGLTEAGRSTFVSDGETPSRQETEGFTINQIWRLDHLPPNVMAEDDSRGLASISPPREGFTYLIATFPPDSSWDGAAGYQEALAAGGDAASHVESEIVGLHETDTLDIVTILSGEIWAVLEEGEVCLKAGDSFVQRGTRHSWSVRGDRPCTLVAVMVGATR